MPSGRSTDAGERRARRRREPDLACAGDLRGRGRTRPPSPPGPICARVSSWPCSEPTCAASTTIAIAAAAATDAIQPRASRRAAARRELVGRARRRAPPCGRLGVAARSRSPRAMRSHSSGGASIVRSRAAARATPRSRACSSTSRARVGVAREVRLDTRAVGGVERVERVRAEQRVELARRPGSTSDRSFAHPRLDQRGAQPQESRTDPALHRSFGLFEEHRDLAVRVPAEVRELDRLALAVGERRERARAPPRPR